LYPLGLWTRSHTSTGSQALPPVSGGTETEIKPGDIVVIPAGIPHQLLLPPGESFYYFVFKVAKSPAR